MKDFDTFSFKPKSKRNHDSIHRSEDFEPPVIQKSSVKNWRQMSYRFQKNTSQIKIPSFQSKYLNEKISKIDEELTQNIRRRIQLQKKLYKQRVQIKQQQNQQFFKQNNCKSDLQVSQLYSNMQKKSNQVQKMLERQSKQNTFNAQDKKDSYLSNVQQNISNKQKLLHKQKHIQKKYVVPDQLRIQKLLRIATFPQLPKGDLQKLEKECQQILIHSQHSDLLYIMMVLSFHLQKYHNVRKYFRQIQMYKVFESKAYWVACQTQFQLESYELCLQLSDICMKKLLDTHLPRFVFLQARSYQKIGNYINSVVCYNQLIKMKPKIAQLYLQRAMIYDKIGYPHQAKLDYIEFSTLQPSAKQILKQKILIQKNEMKRKQMIKALAKIT